jgi:hypothetical protein
MDRWYVYYTVDYQGLCISWRGAEQVMDKHPAQFVFLQGEYGLGH